MAPARGQVKQATRLEHPLLLGLEALEDLQRHALHQAVVPHAADAPVATALHLDQEDVVGIQVRPDPAAIAGVGHHDVVQAGVGHETKTPEQLMGGRHVQVQAVHQQRPRGAGQRRQAASGERAMPKPPGIVGAGHETAFHFLLRCQLEQLGAGHGRLHRGEGLAHQQRLLVPVPAHELRRGLPAQQGQRCVDVHGWIVGRPQHGTPVERGASAQRARRGTARRRPCAIIFA